MFDRLSDSGVGVVLTAQQEARRLDHAQVGTEHLLLGLVANEWSPAGKLLRSSGVTLDGAREKIEEAVHKATRKLPEDELPLSARASRSIDRAHRFAHQRRQSTVGPEMLLLGVLDVEGLACQVLRRLGVDVQALNPKVAELPLDDGPHISEPPPPAPADEQPTPLAPDRHTLPNVPDGEPLDPTPRAAEPAEPRCPWCRASLDGALARRNLDLVDDQGETSAMVALYCEMCGTTITLLPRTPGGRSTRTG